MNKKINLSVPINEEGTEFVSKEELKSMADGMMRSGGDGSDGSDGSDEGGGNTGSGSTIPSGNLLLTAGFYSSQEICGVTWLISGNVECSVETHGINTAIKSVNYQISFIGGMGSGRAIIVVDDKEKIVDVTLVGQSFNSSGMMPFVIENNINTAVTFVVDRRWNDENGNDISVGTISESKRLSLNVGNVNIIEYGNHQYSYSLMGTSISLGNID